MSWVLLFAAACVANVFDDDEQSMFDEPVSWARVTVVCVLIVCAVLVHIFQERT